MLRSYSFSSYDCIDSNKEKIALEEVVLNKIREECKIDVKHIVESVQNYELNRYRAIYFLMLKREIKKEEGHLIQLSAFKTRKRRDSIRLSPLLTSKNGR